MDVYPPGPTTVPRDLTAPSGPYRRNAWVAFIALLVFLGLYFALAAYFGWTAYSLFSKLTRTEANLAFIIGGVAAGFLSLFMFKAVLFVKRGHTSEEIELTRTDQPRLFEFLHRIADDAGAPRPHRVYVSARVNASVFYDLSILNLLIPSRKNLEIGLGLVNVLSLGEVKAVLAHEFGHFAQRTMAIGRWVYIGQQIAGHIVARRDAFDRFLAELSTWDFRIAWIGWIMRLIVWAIRALVDTMFGWVVIAERALSREMEFQADLVAVSLTGSDALVQALYRLEATDHAMDLALGFVQREMRSGHTVSDVFSVQTRMLERSRIILGNPHYGQVPPSSEPPEQRRLFKAQFAAPPRMWSTHPPSNEREANAKRIYIATPVDDRSAWVLFDDPDQLRRRVTADLYIDTAPDAPPIEETIGRLDTDLSRPSLDPKYRGVYLGRAVTRHVAAVSELWSVTGAPTDPKLALAALYPEQLAKDIEQTRELAQEVAMLEALHRGLLATPGGVVR
ncbi:MAG: M48 family metallopeptidase, partial [Kofleriaceae bacterium]